MSRPLTLPEAEARGLVTADRAVAIHTFSNGTEYEGWADCNCFACWFYEFDGPAGGRCAFEGAALLSMVTPELARLFGWTQNAKYDTPTDHRQGWDAPDQCACFRARSDDDGNDNPPAPDPDPLQLVLLADPTEDAAIVAAPERALAEATS